VCVDNGWAISVSSSKQTAAESYAIKALAYGMPGRRHRNQDQVRTGLETTGRKQRPNTRGQPVAERRGQAVGLPLLVGDDHAAQDRVVGR